QVLRVWDVPTGQELLSLPHGSSLPRTAFSPCGRLFAFALAGEDIRVVDLVTGQQVQAFEELPRPVGALVFSPDGTRLAWTGQLDTIKVGDLTTGRVLLTLRAHPDTIEALVFSPDGERLFCGSSRGTIRVWELETGED